MKELRIGLVLYGGVSLAVYMNGVITEIWHALRASVSRQSNRLHVDGTATVYRKLMNDLKQLDGAADLRIVVDTIAGTSAGGVNGAVLGKAIATGANARVLNSTWVERAGIEQLAAPPQRCAPLCLRVMISLAVCHGALKKIRRMLGRTPGIDLAWARDHLYNAFTSDDPGNTPLRGDYFTEMIAGTLESMADGHVGPKLLPPGGRLDLILTRTDLYGWPRHLPVDPCFHDDLFETTHAHRMRFRYRRPPDASTRAPINEFDDDFSLTYAARTTAGFPLAFAPVGFRTAEESYRQARPNEAMPDSDTFAALHLPEHRLNAYSAHTAWMVDGGVLDNKPFTAVTSLIEEKPANRAVYRALMYIEPDPSLTTGTRPARMPAPRKIPGLLYKLFRHEPIFADLHAVGARNRLVDRLVAIANAAETDAKRLMQPDLGENPRGQAALVSLRETANERLRANCNPAYPGYIYLKAKRAADTLASFVSDALGYPYESKHGYFVRAIVRLCLKQQNALNPPAFDSGTERYESTDSQVALLGAFDVPYRLRRLRNMVRIANEDYSRAGVDGRSLDRFKGKLMRVVFAFDQLTEWVGEHREQIKTCLQNKLSTDELDGFIRDYTGRPCDIVKDYELQLGDLYDQLQTHFRQTMEDQGAVECAAVAALPDDLRKRIARAYVLYPMIDTAVFPLMDSAGIGDLSIMRVIRISPHDSRALSTNAWRLKSRDIGAFAGFLRKAAREHDLLWGRLDGAERLIDQIIAAAVDEPNDDAVRKLRADALTEAIEVILDESACVESRKVRKLIATLRKKLPIPSADR